MENLGLNQIKTALHSRVEEWVGYDIPEEGTEDYDILMCKVQEIEDIQSIEELKEYLESEGINFLEFVIEGRYDLITAGMIPEEVPLPVIEGIGDPVDITDEYISGDYSLYYYDRKYFLLNFGQDKNVKIFDKEEEALDFLGINQRYEESRDFKSLISPQFDWIAELKEHHDLMKKTLYDRQKTIKYIIVPEWPGGTMAFKFGSALKSSLYVEENDMQLVQLGPERIFRVNSPVNEQEFRTTLSKYDVSWSGKILFIDLEVSSGIEKHTVGVQF